MRDRLVGRTNWRCLNQLRAVLLERGFTAPQGRHKLELAITVLLDGGSAGNGAISARIRLLVADLRGVEPDRRIKAYDDEFALHARTDDGARRLTTIPGVGVLNATALAAAVGE